jgi:pimeloyl-ACP methyl ester carboxylesterase
VSAAPTHQPERFVLADGRRLAYTVTGPRDGIPVVYCHGAIGTPIAATVDLELLTHELGVRYIAPSRPGVGGSDPLPGRMVRDFAADVRELADALGLDGFAVAGVSAGGPYALAIAHALGDRVAAVAVCSSLSPLCPLHRTPGLRRRVRLALSLLAAAPRGCALAGDAVLPAIARHPGLVSRVIAAHAAPQERRKLAAGAEGTAASTSFLDATAGGVGGLIEDYLVYSRAWGFDPGEVSTEVHLWHGAADPLVPVEHALQLAVSLRRCRLFFDPDEGHHFFRVSLGRILAILIGRTLEPGDRVETTIEGARAAAQLRNEAGLRRQAAARNSASGGRSTS